MINKEYSKNTLEAVTQGQVSGKPARSLDPFRLAKTTIFIILFNTITNASDIDIEKEEAKDVALNKAEIAEGRYWVNGGWVIRKNSQYKRVQGGWVYVETNIIKQYKPAESKEQLVDSDNDGYDDYTEYKNGTDPNDSTIFPAERNGNNKVTFKMDGCKGGFQFPSLSKNILPIETISNGAKILNANK